MAGVWIATLSQASAQRVIATVQTGLYLPNALVLNPVTNKIYVGGDAVDDRITVIDGATNQTTSVIVGNGPTAMAVDPVANKIYVVNVHGNSVTQVDGATNRTITVPLAANPCCVAVNPVTNKAYVASNVYLQPTVTILDGATLSSTTISLPGTNYLSVIAVNPVTNKIYVLNGTSLDILDGATLALTSVSAGPSPSNLAISTVTNKIYVSESDNGQGNGGVLAIDGATLASTEISVPHAGVYVAVNEVTNLIYVPEEVAQGPIAVIDGATLSTSTIASGPYPGMLAIDSTRNKIYAFEGIAASLVAVINGTDGARATVGVDPISAALAVNPTTNRIYVLDGYDGIVSVIDPTPPAASQFVAVAPCRLVDTRVTGNPVPGNGSESFAVPQLGNCDIPAGAAAYSLNVTMVPPPGGEVGFLSIYPTGEAPPNSSLMNSWDGRYKANAVIVPAGEQGGVSVFSSDTTDVVLDINGYFATPSDSTLAFYPLAPCRVADTRWANGALGGPNLSAGQQRDLPVRESQCGIPATVAAYSFNFTVVPRRGPVWVFSGWPAGQQQPGTSTLNAPTGTVVANGAIVPAGRNGDIDVWASNDADLVVDVNGYFAAAGSGGLSLYTVPPCRILDTRTGIQSFTGSLHPPADVVNSGCSTSSTAQAFVLNATAVPTGQPLWLLTLWPDGEQEPNASTLNAWDGAVTSNMALVPTTNGLLDAYAAGLTQLILDISGYFAP